MNQIQGKGPETISDSNSKIESRLSDFSEKETLRVCAKIDLDAIRYNMESMYQNLQEGTKMVAVIKADAYGHGAVGVSAVLEDLPYVWGYAVATAEEAFHLIAAGRKKPMVLLGLTFPQEYESLVEAGVRITISSLDEAKELSSVAASLGKTAYVHIALDTGMGRIGFPTYGGREDGAMRQPLRSAGFSAYGGSEDGAADSSASLQRAIMPAGLSEDAGMTANIDFESSNFTIRMIEAISALENVEIEGIFTHFAKADESDKTYTYEQLKRYLAIMDGLEARGIHIPIRHCSNSAGIIEIREANMNMVRAGITLYGLWPSDEVSRDIVRIHPVMSLESHITYIKVLPEGCSISYGGTYVTARPTRIATVPVGYADGYARSLSNKGSVLIHGKRAPICGRVCMDQFMVDVTDIPQVQVGDLVTLLGQNGSESITMEELGSLSGRFNYEFACLIAPRVPRVFV